MINITPQKYDLEFTRNDDWVRNIRVWADADKTVPFIFTNWTCIMQVKRRSYGNPVIAEFKTSDASMVLTEGNIYLERRIPDTDINPRDYVCDFEFTDGQGYKRTLILTSKFNVLPDITDGSSI